MSTDAGSTPVVDALLGHLARALVDRPDQVGVRASEGPEVGAGPLYELRVAPEDVGKVIGRDGRTVNALRTLLNAAAQRHGLPRVRLEIADDRRAAAALAAPAAVP